MGELEEKETPPAESTAHQEPAEEPKETDKMLDKKDESESTAEASTTKDKNGSPATEKKKKSSSPTGERKSSVSSQKSNAAAADDTKKANGGEEIIDIPEQGGEAGTKANDGGDEGDEKKISKEEREVKPKKIPIGGLKLPGFFTKSKPRADGDGADGELLEKENKDEAGSGETGKNAKKDEKPRANFGERLRNFFVRKTAAEKQKQAAVAAATAAASAGVNGGDADTKSEATAEAAPPSEGVESVPAVATTEEAPPPKRGLLNAIKLPIANMIPKKKTENDVELGLGKAGLASMETLDDSLKDQDCVDKAVSKNNGTDDIAKLKKTPSGEIKQDATEEKPQEDPQPQTFRDRMRNYRCSVDDALIALGILLFVLLLGVIGYALSHETLTSPPVREGRFMDAVTSCGMVEGLKEDGVFAFRGIPYALPPLDDLRWKSAKLIEGIDDCWNGTFKAHNASELCTQMLGNGTIIGDEDCLYLDVFTPSVRYDSPLPVVVLIGADSLTGPSPGVLRPSAVQARSHDVIFVRPNFRLGAFGFLALDALTKDAYPRTSGNYGLSDIIAALTWVNLNIAHFGGDTKSITLLGHRAGGTLVSALVTSKKAKGLYTRAWVSSSSAIFPGKPLHESEKRNQELMNVLDCKDVECLRSASTEQIWAATPDTWLHFPVDIPTVEENTTSAHHEWLVLDGAILLQHPADSWKEDASAEKTTLVMGTTAHESHTDKLRSRYTNWTADEVRAFIENSKIGALNLTDAVITRYNATNYRSLVALITDIRTICPLLTNVRLQPMVPFYVVTQGEGRDQLAHVDSDMLAILGRHEQRNTEERRFVATMQNLFYYYVTHGVVPQYDPRRRVLNVGEELTTQEDHANCNFWISNDIVPRYARVD